MIKLFLLTLLIVSSIARAQSWPFPRHEYEATVVFGFEVLRHQDVTTEDVQYTMHQLRAELWLLEQLPLGAKTALRDYARILLHRPETDPTDCGWFCWRYEHRAVVIVDHRKNEGYPSTLFRETALIHELAHAWHSRIWDRYWLEYDINLDGCLDAALNRARIKALTPDLRGIQLQHLRKLNRQVIDDRVLDTARTPLYDGRPYWAVNRNEFFAEMSTAFLGRHSMYPRNRVDLFEWDAEIAQTLSDLWQADDVLSPQMVQQSCNDRLRTTWY